MPFDSLAVVGSTLAGDGVTLGDRANPGANAKTASEGRRACATRQQPASDGTGHRHHLFKGGGRSISQG